MASPSKITIDPVFVDDVGLRLLEEQDIEMLRGWRNQDDIRFFFTHSEIITVEQQKSWFSAYRRRDDDYYFIIFWHDGKEYVPVGGISLSSVVDGKAEWGRFLIGEKRARNRGLAVKVGRILLDIARTQLGLSELYLKVFHKNPRAIHIYEQLGFERTAKDEEYTFMSLRL